MVESRLPAIIISITLAAGVMLTGNAILHQLDQSTDGIEQTQHEIALLDQNDFVELTDEYGYGHSQTVLDSRGLAIEFTGASDSYVTSTNPITFASDDTWTVSQPVLRVDDENHTQTVLALGDPNLLLRYVNASSGDYWEAVWVSATDSYNVTVPVVSPDNETFLVVERNQSTLTIYRGTTQGGTANLSKSSSLSGNLTTAENFAGVVDETRTFDDVLTSGERDQLRTNPVSPLVGTNRTARLMYDEGAWTDSLVYVFFASSNAELSNASYVDGFDGHVMDVDTGMLDTGDYYWRTSPPAIKPTEDARLDGAPVAYVTFEFETSASRIRQAWTETVGLVDLAFIVLMLGVVVTALTRLNRQR